MNCWSCGTELIWNSDFDLEDEKEMDKIYPELTEEEVNIMYEDFFYGDVDEAIREYEKNVKNYKFS